MNFSFFQTLYEQSDFDEIKVIGKDIVSEGQNYHILGMSLKEKQAVLYVVEMMEECWEEGFSSEVTPRESLKNNMKQQATDSMFLHVREFQGKNQVYPVSGATSGAMKNTEYVESFFLFMKMTQAGWKVPENSVFYDISWERLRLTTVELQEKWESLPEWTEDMQILADRMPESHAIELPVLLECGKSMDLEFTLADGTSALCCINNIYTMDIWADEEKRFADPVYRERILQYMSEAEFETMKQQFFQTLEEHCPKGKYYMVVEYECSENITLTFYDREYLDMVEEPQIGGTASSIMMRVKPEAETGLHGWKLRGCVIQKPLDAGMKSLEAELFSYSNMIEKSNLKVISDPRQSLR